MQNLIARLWSEEEGQGYCGVRRHAGRHSDTSRRNAFTLNFVMLKAG
jgi:hypothetical protein